MRNTAILRSFAVFAAQDDVMPESCWLRADRCIERMFMRRVLFVIAAIAAAFNAFAVAPQFWRVNSAEDFLAGETEGFAITSRGELRPAPAMKKIATLTDPFVLSQTTAPNGDRFVGTGVEGKLFRVTPKGEGKVLYDSTDTHVRSIAERKDGSILAGGSGKGRIYEIAANGSARALFDSPLNEISAIYVDTNGVGWAAGVSNVLPSSVPAKAQPKNQQQQQQQQQGAQPSGDAKKEGEATANVEVSFSFDDGGSPAAAASQAGR